MIDDERPGQPAPENKSSNTNISAGVPAFGAASSTKLPKALPAKIAHHHRRFKEWYGGLSGKAKVAFIASVILVVGLIGCGLTYALYNPQATPGAPVTATYQPPKPTTVASTLTGLQVDPSVNKRPVIGVMIENSLMARPQSGLDQAGVVFEAVAEGGITRFLALFQDTKPSYVGPVRSARPYYVQWCQGFDCAYAHVGGSPTALNDIKKWGIHDLNQFFGASYFKRISSRAAPHNVYTSISNLTKFAASRGYKTSTYTGFTRALKEGTADDTQTKAHSIRFDYAGTAYDVKYSYDAKHNSYKRSLAGKAHNAVDAKGTTTRITPKVVIAMAVQKSQGALDSSNAYYTEYKVVGSGKADIFQNGTVIHATWQKTARDKQISFTDKNGSAVALNPGQTWISVLDSLKSSSYK